METKLERISQLSREKPNMIFTSIGHLIDKQMLIKCHNEMDGNKAVGIDGISKSDYEINLGENIERLVIKLRNKSYKPQPARRVEIPKDNGKTRPLSIYCYEDKLMQQALKEILEAVFEPHLYDELMGFRPNRGCHEALRKLNKMIENNPTNYILDADIKSFFNHLSHEWIIKFVESKIKDPNITRLLQRTLKSGVINEEKLEDTLEGSGQGSVCSPIIANIYMNYVLGYWFHEVIKPHMKGFCGLVVYADDFVVCFQYKTDAELFYNHLINRMEYFGLSLETEKSRLIKFGRYAAEDAKRLGTKPETFDFLGFTHYCSVNRYNRFRVKRKTSRKKFCKKCKEINLKIKDMRTYPLKIIMKKLNEILVGYFHYYGITDNSRFIKRFRYIVIRRLFYWLNQRGQRLSYTWARFNDMLKAYPLAQARIYVSIYA